MSERFGKVWDRDADKLGALVALDDEGRLLRHVMADGCRIVLWDTFRPDGRGTMWLGYALWDPEGNKVFEGEDYAGSPMDSIDSDETLRCLIGFLALSPGDTDAEYFADYTDDQRSWAESSACEELSLWAHDEQGETSFVDDPE